MMKIGCIIVILASRKEEFILISLQKSSLNQIASAARVMCVW